MVTRKDRRRSGWYTPTSTIRLNKKEIIGQCLEPQPEYDEWTNWRDGFRGFSIYRDKTRLKPVKIRYGSEDFTKSNKIVKRKIYIRKLRKQKKRQTTNTR
jgi:hypothetical protein